MSESTPQWYTQGFGGIKKEEERLANAYGPPRFWLKPEGSTQIVFVDDEPACIHEHNPKINGSWMNWFTCLKDIYPDDVECCTSLGFDTRYYVGYFTVVDLAEWKDKKGNMHQYELKLFPAKLKTLKLLQQKKEDRDNRLAGRIYKVRRTDKQSPGCGNDFEFDRDADMSKLFQIVDYRGKKLSEMFKSDKPEDMERVKRTFAVRMDGDRPAAKIVPFNYFSVLAPKPPKDLRDFLRGVKIEKDEGGSTETESGSKKADDDVPF